MTDSSKKAIITLAAIVVVAAIGTLIYYVASEKKAAQEQQSQIEQLQLKNDQLQLASQYQLLDNQFKNLEGQTQYIKNDTVLVKYNQAKARVEELLKELNSNKATSAKRIKELQNEIVTLKGIMRHYVSIIDSLGKENAGLKLENSQMRSQNEALTSQVAEATAQNDNLNKRMTLAEKLNITGLSLTPLKGNGKTEKKVTKARQLMVNFTVTQNNSTPAGIKQMYVRITGPEGSLLGQSGTFSFEGGHVAYTAHKAIEYGGQEVPVTLYYNVNTTLNPGQYTVEVFDGRYRLGSRSFVFSK